MKYKVEITEKAKNEAEFTFKWIEQESPSNAISWYNELIVLHIRHGAQSFLTRS